LHSTRSNVDNILNVKGNLNMNATFMEENSIQNIEKEMFAVVTKENADKLLIEKDDSVFQALSSFRLIH
jgi:hypothetical protein